MGGFPYSQAHNLLTRDQPDPKDNVSPIKKKYEKVEHFDPNFRDGPLRLSNALKEIRSTDQQSVRDTTPKI